MDRERDVVAQNEAGRRLFDEGRFDEARDVFLRVASDPAALGAAINVGVARAIDAIVSCRPGNEVRGGALPQLRT
jgi:hypothetical protein